MKFFIKFLVGLVLLVVLVIGAAIYFLDDYEAEYQAHADSKRREHLIYWAGVIDKYKAETGHYPLQDKVSGEDIIQVRIITDRQREYMVKGGKNYRRELDYNANGRFKEFPVSDLVAEISRGLGYKIEERYDMQTVPTASPVGYYYFVSKDGYVFWVTCISCGVTEISTLLMDGYTPTLNIVSEGMKGKVTKALTREEMMANPVFEQWMLEDIKKGAFDANW